MVRMKQIEINYPDRDLPAARQARIDPVPGPIDPVPGPEAA